ncbi:hybrid sensor histidine kinase/response regulator [Ramlibacter tataouinensis]|uniref:histidine kinase n=1 Tax=Ramlibacter tataouinensis (strain ATCC BAA-407 / DSM 14655 / LMG 21543 / TTB310) TaxID=365046 RepID=F5Y2U9_RAMTT|nr:response regulator [Ramlibacter tataouinensis]AEG93645.1 candidate histidine kinase, atypical hybrid [Ramlibacter tataouinensis TTB310]
MTPPDHQDRPLAVLLLEDSRFDAELLREALLAAYPQARLEVVRDEEGFEQAIARGGWDLILSDYELPGFSGAAALEMARQHAPEVPFIFVSGVIGEDNAVEMLKRGATDYVSKSRMNRLSLVVDRALREVAQRTGRESAETRLREANEVYARVVDSLRNYAVILLDTRGMIRSWNAAARDIFGFEREELVGRSAEVLFTPEDRQAGTFQAELRDALRKGKADDNRWLMRSDGLRLWAEGVVMPLYDDARHHSGYCKVVRDATAEYRAAEALRAAKEQAERANQAKDRFLAVLSHELRTPLTPIATAASLLERTATVPDKYRELLPMIRRNVALEARLIEDLLDLTAISAGKVSLRLGPVDMHRLVHGVVDMVSEQIAERQLRLTLELRAPNPMVQADEARIQQVVWNLLRNAIKFTPHGGQVVVRTESDRRWFTLGCTDTGIGIDPEALPRIFQAFEQADQEVSQHYGGLGLGLAIARGLVAEHKGELCASSQGRGHGATFTLKLRTLAAADVVQTDAPGESDAESREAGHRLLLVEDNIDAAETMMMLLEDYGYQVTHAPTCAAALQAAREKEFDVVLTDLGLPDGSGIEVGRQLSARLPVVALSGYGASQDLQRSAMAGFAGHLVKPADPDTIHTMLQKVLEERYLS